MVTQEVGTLSDARSMPTEMRRWWIDQMFKEREQRAGQQAEPVDVGGKRIVTRDV